MKKVVRLTESDLTRIVKQVLVTESQQQVDKIKTLNKKYPGEKTAEWCAYAVLDGTGKDRPQCYIKNCLGSRDNFCKNVKDCPSCYGSEFMYAHAKMLSCMTSCYTGGEYNDMECGVYEGNFYC